MLTYPMEERGSLPLYEYLCRRIRADILSGALPAGTRLPSKRALAETRRCSASARLEGSRVPAGRAPLRMSARIRRHRYS